MSFAPRPVNTPNYQRHRFGSNLPTSSRIRGQDRPNPSNSNNPNHVYHLGNNLGNNNVADFTARRQQVSPKGIPQFTNFPQTPRNFSPPTKTSLPPNFVAPNPWWLRSLLFLKYGSGLLTGGLIFVTITIYGGNVSTQRQWSESYQQLESLRRTERQLVVTNEVIKNKAAQESSTTKQLVRLDPSQRVYLPTPNPVPEASPKIIGIDPSQSKTVPKTEPAKNYPNLPLGY